MRRALVLCLLLAGCAQTAQPNGNAEALAAYDRLMASRAPEPPPPELPGTAELRQRAARQAQAEAICRARADMAGATYGGRGGGLAGSMTAGFEAGIAAERVRAACLDAYQRTGVMPTL